MNCTLMSIEDIYCSLELDEAFLLEATCHYEIWLDGPFIRIQELDVDIYPGVYCQYDETDDDFIPDFTIHIFKRLGTNEVVYDEGCSTLYCAINNYIQLCNKKIASFEQLPCEIIYK